METPPPPRRLRAAVAQMVFAPTLERNLEQIAQATRAAARAGADVILFPECATTGYAIDFDALDSATLRAALREVGRLAADGGIQILVGSAIEDGRRRFNGLVVFDRRGRFRHAYAKCQLTEGDRRWFTPGDALSLFTLDGVQSTTIICHERRYPELVRLPVMAGAQIVFHPNAGLDELAVSKAKRRGRDGIPVRAFENAIYYLFANSVGPQGGGKWSAGDSKIVAPDGTFLALADNRRAALLVHDLDLGLATRKYACDSRVHPRFLAAVWRRLLPDLRRRAVAADARFRAWYEAGSRGAGSRGRHTA